MSAKLEDYTLAENQGGYLRYSAQQIKSLRLELTAAMKSADVVAALEGPASTVDGEPSLVHCAAREKILGERSLHVMIRTLRERKDRAHFNRIVNDDSLGHETVRSYWREESRFCDADPGLSLDHLIKEYRRSNPASLCRLLWISLIFGQAYREKSWDFILSWARGATDAELARVNNRYLYGAVTGLINSGQREAAAEMLERRDRFMSNLDRLYFTVPLWRLASSNLPPPTNDELVAKLHAALPDRGPEWDWFCSAYRAKIATARRDFVNARMDESLVVQLRAMVLEAIKKRQALSFHRLGDGGVYRFPLPEIAALHADKLPADDRAREMNWWDRPIEPALGDRYAGLVLDALRKADIIGVCSAHRLIRDANNNPMTEKRSGRALLAHIEALGELIPLDDKIVTEDRIHTILYTDDFLEEMISAADKVVVIGGLSPKEMGLPYAEDATFLALTPEQNKGLPTVEGARSIVDDFDAIARDVTEACAAGTLALVSGGYLGKALVQVAKASGAVALDIGSRADRLAGRHTRSPADAI